jgi:hypothetical protein
MLIWKLFGTQCVNFKNSISETGAKEWGRGVKKSQEESVSSAKTL